MSHQQKSDDNPAKGFAALAKAIREHAATTKPESKQELDQRDRKHLWIQRWGVAFAAIYAGLTLWLLLVTKDAVSLTREQVHIGQRAYLVVRHARLREPLAEGQPQRVTFDIQNTGQTPAVGVKVAGYMDVFDGFPPRVLQLPATDQTGDIGAGQSLSIWQSRINPLTKADFEAVNRDMFSLEGNRFTMEVKGRRLMLYGLVTYKDVFGGDGETEFCLVYMPPSMQTTGDDGIARVFGECTAPGRNRLK